LFERDDYPSLLRLEGLDGLEASLGHICDILTNDPEMHVYRLSDDKTLKWLRAKVDHLSSCFDDIGTLKLVLPSPGDGELSPKDHIDLRKRATVDVIAEYLSLIWIDRLRGSYDFSNLIEIERNDMEKYEWMQNYPKRARNGERENIEPVAKKAKKMSHGEKVLSKVNTRGMKSLVSFFSKK